MCKHLLIKNFNNDTDFSTIKNFTMLTNENDGYGAIFRNKKGDLSRLRSIDLASFYIELTKTLLKGDVSELVIHHRTSTNESGVKSAHPFIYKGNFLTHNGVVRVPNIEKYSASLETKNDSEALLHHLIETDYNTDSIDGYFSCFILNSGFTAILVDETAPMYTDTANRVFCSHNLDKTMTPIEKKHIVFKANSNDIVKNEPIKLMEYTGYGADKAHLSLGNNFYSGGNSGASLNAVYFKDYGFSPSQVNNAVVEDFIYFSSPNDERYILAAETKLEMKNRIRETAEYLQCEMNDEQLDLACEMFLAGW